MVERNEYEREHERERESLRRERFGHIEAAFFDHLLLAVDRCARSRKVKQSI